jgi:hypothetical protein
MLSNIPCEWNNYNFVSQTILERCLLDHHYHIITQRLTPSEFPTKVKTPQQSSVVPQGVSRVVLSNAIARFFLTNSLAIGAFHSPWPHEPGQNPTWEFKLTIQERIISLFSTYLVCNKYEYHTYLSKITVVGWPTQWRWRRNRVAGSRNSRKGMTRGILPSTCTATTITWVQHDVSHDKPWIHPIPLHTVISDHCFSSCTLIPQHMPRGMTFGRTTTLAAPFESFYHNFHTQSCLVLETL